MKRLAILLLLVPHLAWGAISFNSADQKTDSFVDIISISPLIVLAGADRVLVVLSMNDQTGATTFPTGCSYGGTPMTAHTAFTSDVSHEAQFYYLALGTSASNTSLTLSCTYTNAGAKPGIVAAAYNGVDQATPITSMVNSGSAGASNPAAWSIGTSPVNDWVVALWFAATVGVSTPTPGTGTVIRLDNSTGSIISRYAMDEISLGPSVVISATMQFNDNWFGTAANLKVSAPAVTGGAGRRLLLGVGQ